jgi:hypothetical protein
VSAAGRTAAGSVLSGYSRAALPVAESSISTTERFRFALLGLLIGLTAFGLTTLLALLITAALFAYPGGLS